MRINYFNETIEMSKSESKRASVIGSDEYKALLSVKNDFPTYHIVIIAKEAKRSDDIKGLTYDYMEEYITNEGTPEQLNRFNTLREGIFNTRGSYGEIRKWFLEEFPQISEFRERIKNILAHKEAV
jgi:hypothetical protein